MLKSKIENKGAQTLYIRRKKGDVWHWHPSCLFFQKIEDDEKAVRTESVGRPASYELCNLCRIKEKRERKAGD